MVEQYRVCTKVLLFFRDAVVFPGSIPPATLPVVQEEPGRFQQVYLRPRLGFGSGKEGLVTTQPANSAGTGAHLEPFVLLI